MHTQACIYTHMYVTLVRTQIHSFSTHTYSSLLSRHRNNFCQKSAKDFVCLTAVLESQFDWNKFRKHFSQSTESPDACGTALSGVASWPRCHRYESVDWHFMLLCRHMLWWIRAFYAVVYICAMVDPNKLSFPEPAYKFNSIIISKGAV